MKECANRRSKPETLSMYDIGQQMLTLIFNDKQSFQEDAQSDYGAYHDAFKFTEIDISPEKDMEKYPHRSISGHVTTARVTVTP